MVNPDLTLVRKITVRDGNREIKKINELEVVGGQWVFANVFTTNRIV